MNSNFKKIEEYVDSSIVKYNEPMSKHTTIKIGGPADVLVTPTNIEEIKKVVEFAKKENIAITILGNGSKLLVKDEGIRGIVIKITGKFANINIEGEYITAEAGITLPRLSIIAKDRSLSGLEFAAGIPGCLGGAIFMNAGAYGSEMSNIVTEVTYLDKDLNIVTKTNEELDFGYRQSYFKNNEEEKNIVLSVRMKLEKGNKEEITEKMQQNNKSRKEKQPLEFPNAGSTFKRPEGYFVGKLIDDVGLRGKKIGGAMISDKHSGFIVNVDKATAKDVLDLITLTQKVIKEKFNVNLETEIKIIGG